LNNNQKKSEKDALFQQIKKKEKNFVSSSFLA